MQVRPTLYELAPAQRVNFKSKRRTLYWKYLTWRGAGVSSTFSISQALLYESHSV